MFDIETIQAMNREEANRQRCQCENAIHIDTGGCPNEATCYVETRYGVYHVCQDCREEVLGDYQLLKAEIEANTNAMVSAIQDQNTVADHKFTPAYHGNVTYDDKLNQCHFGKRHYKAIAGVLHTFLVFYSLEDRAIVASVTEALADLFERDNPKFNREQFYEMAGACSRRYAMVPEIRKEVCLHDSGGRWSGSMPCTGQYKCTMCGTQLIPYTSHPI